MDVNEIKGYIQDNISKMNLQEAYDLIVQYKKIYSYDDEIASMEAIINIYEGNYDEALNCIREGLEINIYNSDLYFTMGNVYELREKYNNAYLCYEHALSLSNTSENKEVIVSTINILKEKTTIGVNGCSIVILTYNNLEYTKVCIDSIRKYNNSNTYEIIIVDNNSTDGTVEWIKEQKDIKYILNAENRGFPIGCNQGIEIAENENDIFLLNNDTVIMPNSIFNLRMGLYSDGKVGATGAVSNSVSYYQQIVEVFEDFDGYMKYAKQNNISNEESYEQRVKLVGFAMLIKRNVLDKVGLLDERFTPGNFEDDDISLRIVQEGYKLLLCKDSYIHHFGSITFGNNKNSLSELLAKNSMKFQEKWNFKNREELVIRTDLIQKINYHRLEQRNCINILDVGSGVATTSLYISHLFKNANVYAFDSDDNVSRINEKIVGIISVKELSRLKNENVIFDIIIVSKKSEYNKLIESGIVVSNEYQLVKDNTYHIGQNCDIRGIERMEIGDGVVIQESTWLNIAYENPNHKTMIEIKNGSNIGRRGIVSAANKVILEEKVLLGPNVYISDCGHEYSDINIPIMDQGIDCCTNEIVIGSGTWVGMNSIIVGNVRIGKNCVIGANSVVNKDIPDYSVAVGSPAKVVKIFDTVEKVWKRVNSKAEIDEILEKRKEKYRVDIKNLKSIQVEVSSVCNLKCPQCFNNIPGHKEKILSNNLWNDKIRPILGQLTDIHLVGIGEPLLCKNFFEYAKECSDLGVHVHTTSNLQLVDEKIAERFIKSGVKYLSFSCDGVSEFVYSKIRINGTLEKLKNSINLINKYKKIHNSEYPKLILNFGAMNSNINELPEIIYLAKEMEVDQVVSYHDVIYYKELECESLYYNQNMSDDIFNKAKDIALKEGVKYFYPGTFSNPIKYQPIKDRTYCSYPYSHLWIYSDGRVGPCCMDFPNRIILGDLNYESLEEIWNGKKMKNLRESLDGKACIECRYCLMHGKMDLTNSKFLLKF